MTERKASGESDDPLKAKILRALMKGGYALEMRVAAKTRSSGATTVIQSGYYLDQDTSKIREIDVAALWVDISGREINHNISLWLTIECKSKPAPWVIFDQGDPLSDFDIEFIFSRIPQISSRAGSINFYRAGTLPGQSAALFSPARYGFGSGIVEVSFKENLNEEGETSGKANAASSKSNQPNGAWAAVQAAVSAASGMRAEWLEKLGAQKLSRLDSSMLMMWVPVVVTSGRLYRCRLDDSGSMELEEVNQGSVSVGSGPRLDNVRCLVATEAGFDSLLTDASSTFELLSAHDLHGI